MLLAILLGEFALMVFPTASIESVAQPVNGPAKEEHLGLREASAIRKAVYTESIVMYTDKSDPTAPFRAVGFSDGISESYKTKPVGTLRLLQTIVKGARPDDAIRACTIALTLSRGPQAGVPVFALDRKTFDDEDSVGKSMRERYVDVIDGLILKATKNLKKE